MRVGRFLLIGLCVGWLLSCSFNRDPSFQVTRKFLDAYYVMADQKSALPLTVGRATENLTQELALLSGVQDRGDSYKSRDVSFVLKNTEVTGADVNYFYELTITTPGLGKMTKHVHLVVDTTLQKIKDFRAVD